MNKPYRYLTLRHEQRLLANNPPALRPGEARFHSFYLPSLPAGKHAIRVNQKVKKQETDPNGVDALQARQEFTVIAPRYSISDDIVSTVFPAPGHAAMSTTLPHIVFKDPHLPWEREVWKDDGDEKNCVPWIALIPFSPEELELTKDERDMIFPDHLHATINEDLAWNIKTSRIKDIRGTDVTNFIPLPNEREQEEETSLIAVNSSLFKSLFMGNTGKCDIAKYRFLSHVREVATDGMLSAIDGDSGVFSLTVSHRLGAYDVKTATPVVVHLVSLEGVHGTEDKDIRKRVLMTSLYSWSYTALPDDSFNIYTTLLNLAKEKGVLRTARTNASASNESGVPPPIEDLVTKRQNDGYNLIRYYTITGEDTAAIVRGPLVPAYVDSGLHPDIAIQSNFGSDLQILDKQLGLMDISYASAWQLGKTLAMGDPSFTAAWSRLRGVIHNEALRRAKKAIYTSVGAYSERNEVIKSMRSAVDGLHDLNAALHATRKTVVSTNRWKRGNFATVNTTLRSNRIFSQMYAHAKDVASVVSKSIDGSTPYSYHSVPHNTDYAVIQEWVLDKLHLASIPAHYLIPDPSYLPEEAIRFFYVDENWTQALVDGALSLANHYVTDPEEDYCRSSVKEKLNEYLRTPLPGLGYCQQMPRYGFLLRSQMLVQYPDLAVSAKFKPSSKGNEEDEDVKPKAPILIQRQLESDIMLCLFDREPSDLTSVEFTPPAHQQTFSIAAQFKTVEGVKKMDIIHKKIYACKQPPTDIHERRKPLHTEDYIISRFMDLPSRTMKVEEYTSTIYDRLRGQKSESGEELYIEKAPTSAMLALQLNEPIHTLLFTAELHSTESNLAEPLPSMPFSFRIPDFPEHKYHPKEPLPAPIPTPKFTPVELHRQCTPVVAHTVAPPRPLGHVYFNGYIPQFAIDIYPIGAPGYVPTTQAINPDLVVSIVLFKENWGKFSYRLKSLRLEIEMGTEETATSYKDKIASRPLIHQDYKGPKPTMLSNMRFNVLRSFENGKLVLNIVSRSTKYGTSMRDVIETSFILPMVHVIPWQEEYKSRVTLRHKYVDERLELTDIADIVMRPH